MDKSSSPSKGSVISAMFLVAGTCIGGGMLALPVATGVNGFVPSLVMMMICWLAMTSTALLLLEATLWMEEGVHVITMTSRLLGTPAKVVSWILFLFVSYASIVAYTAGAGLQIASGLDWYWGITLSKDLGAALFIALFGAVVYLGSVTVGRVNTMMFVAMLAAYFGLVGMGLDEVKPALLMNKRWTGAYMAIPLLLTAFSFQTMVPSLTPYLKKNAKSLRWAIVGGTGVAFLIYAIWQWIILGIVPAEGSNSLAEALSKGEPATQFLREHVEGRWINQAAEFFAFFAIATSFLGITLGLFDFLSDGLKIKKEGWGKVFLGLLIVVPTLIFATQFERIFLLALDATGGYGDTVLNGLIPVAMVWVGRYKLGYDEQRCLPGGKVALVLVFIFFFAALTMEILAHSGQILSIYEVYDVFKPSLDNPS